MMITDRHLRLCTAILALAASLPGAIGQADEQSQTVPQQEDAPSLGTIINHDHDPIHVRSKPVIERLPIKVIEPVDLKIAGNGHLYVADRKAECVFRLDVEGHVSFAVRQLAGIQRIQLDADDNLFVLTSSVGASAIHQVTPSGRRVVLENLEFPSSSFVRDPAGETIVAVANTGRLMVITSDGELTERAALPSHVSDLTMNAGRQVEALLASGHVAAIPKDGAFEFTGFAPIGATRLLLRDDGAMVALHAAPIERPGLFVVSYGLDRPDKFEVAAHVPEGTQGVGFDALGNLCLVNPDLRAVTKVTTRFMIPCPHCARPTLMIFGTEAPAAAPATSRRF